MRGALARCENVCAKWAIEELEALGMNSGCVCSYLSWVRDFFRVQVEYDCANLISVIDCKSLVLTKLTYLVFVVV